MPPENKQSSVSSNHISTTSNLGFSLLPTLFSVVASAPLRQHIAILTKDPSPPTIMHITHNSAPATSINANDVQSASLVPIVAIETLRGDSATEASDASSPTIKSESNFELNIKQEQGLSKSVISAVAAIPEMKIEREGWNIKQEPRSTEPHIFSQSTDEEDAANESFITDGHPFASQRSELDDQLSSEMFQTELSLDPAKSFEAKPLSRTMSGIELQEPVATITATEMPSISATKYKWKTVTITKEVLVIDLEDTDDDEDQNRNVLKQIEGEKQPNETVTSIVKDEANTSISKQQPEPSATVLGKRIAASPNSDDEELFGQIPDDTITSTSERLSKRLATDGSKHYPLELLDSDSEPEDHKDKIAAGDLDKLSVSTGSDISQQSSHNKEHIGTSDIAQEPDSSSQQMRAHRQQQQEIYVNNQLTEEHQPISSTAAAPTLIPSQPQQSEIVSDTIQPLASPTFDGSLHHYQSMFEENNIGEDLPPPYAVHGPQPLQLSYPDYMTKDGFELTQTQRHVIDLVVNQRRNVFFTGSAGTGKSVLLRELILRLRAKHSRWRRSNDDWDTIAAGHVAITASTGIAACNIRGCTVHSFAGIGLGTDPWDVLYNKIRSNRNAVNRWKSTMVLVIDEVSMISAELLDTVEKLARYIRNDRRPWGGIQVVLVGDFFQLPPVEKAKEPRFCFEADAWRSIDTCIQLEKVFRQSDHVFVDALNQLRVGILSQKTLRLFKSLNRSIPEVDGIKPTELFPLRKQVDEANASMLVKLPGNSHFYQARDSGPLATKMDANCIAPSILELKVNAQVMLLKNQSGGSTGLVNGSIGVIIEMTTEAASNVRTKPDGTELPSLNNPGEILPKVRFMHDTGGYTDMVLGREEWTVEAPGARRTIRVENGLPEVEYELEVLGRRVQIPLCLAWAMSIHKSQGQTLPKVKVDLGRVFEKGQAYVALSRATSLEGLQVAHFDERKVMVHQKVVNFYEQIGGCPI